MVDNSELPILIIAFNRVNLTRDLIKSLRGIAPKRVFYTVDGSKTQNPADLKINLELRNLISIIDWPCTIETLFSDSNLGAGAWPHKSIDWALSKSQTVLILEDDVRISESFYDLAAYCLENFKNNKDIFSICASNIADPSGSEKSDWISATKYFSGWGWATWADRWQSYRYDLNSLMTISYVSLLKLNNFNIFIALYFWLNFYRIRNNRIQAWDYQINHLLFSTQMKVLKPLKNLSTNVGVGTRATHTKQMPLLKLNTLQPINTKYQVNLDLNPKNEKLWRKFRLMLLRKSLILRILRK
jgi:hypothetical protein